MSCPCLRFGGAAPRPGERGAALLVATFILIVVLVGGLAAVAITSGELAGSRGFRTQQTAQACAQIGLARARALLNPSDLALAIAAKGTTTLGSGELHFCAGHYGSELCTKPSGDSTKTAAVRLLDPENYDAAALSEGANVTNALLGGGGSRTNLYAITSVCSGSGFGEREVETIFKYSTGK